MYVYMSLDVFSILRKIDLFLDTNSGGLPKKRTKAPDGASASSTTVGSGSGRLSRSFKVLLRCFKEHLKEHFKSVVRLRRPCGATERWQ